MAHALLINPSYAGTYSGNEGGIAYPIYPVVGLASLGGAIVDAGHTFRIVDLSYRRYDPDVLRTIVREERPDVVGITATTPLANQMRDMSYLVKDVDERILTIGGGAHPSAMPVETLRVSAFYVVAVGDADFSVAELLDGTDYRSIPGLYGRDGNLIESTGSRGLISDLDTLPDPAWEQYPVETTTMSSRLVARHLPVAAVEFSRGCIYGCDFCASKMTMGRGYRKKSPERCAEELARLEALGFREAILVDDIFTTDTQWASAVCEEIIRRRLSLSWTATNGIRVDAVDRDLLELMRRAGCYRVSFGFETGNESVLKAFGKGGRSTLDRGRQAAEVARRVGLEVNGFFLVGLMTDDETSMHDTMNYATQLSLDAVKCGICMPFPGTDMFQELHRQGRIRTFDWDAYTVYNKEPVFDHPRLDWAAITRAFDRFYRQLYFKNPRYILRRALSALRHGELLVHLRYLWNYLRLLATGDRRSRATAYAYEDRWRSLDWTGEAGIERPPVAIARREGSALSIRPRAEISR